MLGQEGCGGPHVNVKAKKKQLSLPGLVAIIYYSVSGGPYGSEAVVSAAGPLLAIVGFLVMPLVWSIPEALVAAELSTTFPHNSGCVVWVTAAYGPFWGFMEGYLSWVSASLDTAIYPILFKAYVTRMWPYVAQYWPGYIFAACVSIGLSSLNYFGLSIVGWTAVAFAIFTISPFLQIVPMAAINMDPSNLLILPASAEDIDWKTYLNVLFWNLNYWDSASALAGEVEHPRRTFPKALLVTMFLVFATYLPPLIVGIGLGNPTKDPEFWKKWGEGTYTTIGLRVGGKFDGAWVIASAAVSNLGMFITEQAECAYALLGMADAGFLPGIFASRTRFGTPALGLAISLTIVLVVILFDFQNIVDMLNGIYCFSQLLEFAAFLQLRSAHGDHERPYKLPLSSTRSCFLLLLVPLSFCVLILALPFFSRNWGQIGLMFAAPLSGCVLYFFFTLSRNRGWFRYSACPPQNFLEVIDMNLHQEHMSTTLEPEVRNLACDFLSSSRGQVATPATW